MDEESPLDSPKGNWWNRNVNRRETIWLGLSGAWAMTLFGWIIGWTQIGSQNPTGPTYELSPEEFREKVQAYKQRAPTMMVNGEEMLVPPENDVYIGAFQWAWDGLPAVLQPGKTYKFHLGSYDVQHGFSVRHEDNLSQQMSLQVLPGYEWVIEMSFDKPGTYHVVCNEFCGVGHRSMHGKFEVQSYDPAKATQPTQDEQQTAGAYGGWFTGKAKGGKTKNFDGSPADKRGSDQVTVQVGAEGNGGTFAYEPAAVVVSPGTTVTFDWVSNNHNVVVERQPDGAGWKGHETLENKGFSFEHTFDTEGVYKYYCRPHVSLGMKGVVEVK